MVSSKVTAALLGAFYATSAVAGGADAGEDMGPAGLMWPPDRKWSDKHDNNGPCGSDAPVGDRTAFPMTNGRLALVAQENVRAVHISLSYKSDPKTMDDFTTFFGPNEVGTLDLGHTCIPVPDVPSDVRAGDNATFSILYVSNYDNGESERETYYACSDVTFVDFSTFDDEIPCFNSTVNDPEVKVDDVHNVITTDEDGNTPHDVSDFTTNDKSSSSSSSSSDSSSPALSGGEIAGVVIGALAGVVLFAALGFWLGRRSSQKSEEKKQMRQLDAEKAHSDTLSTRS